MKFSPYRAMDGRLFCLFTLLAIFTCALCPADAADTWGIRNNGSAWGQGQEGVAVDGACYGMVVAAKTHHELKLDKTRAFADVTTPKISTGGSAGSKQLFVEQFAALAQNYALRNRRADKEIYSLPSDPAAVDSSLQSSGVSPDKPQILILTNQAAAAANPPMKIVGHAVLVQGREERGNVINYKVSDPNSPGVEKTITYDKSTGSFTGLEGYDTVHHDTSKLPQQNEKWMEALLKGAAQPAGKEYLPVWRGNKDLPLTDDQYKQERQSGRDSHMVEPPSPSPGVSKGVSAIDTDRVGGVRLYFDPAIVDDTEHADARWDMIRDLTERITSGEENFLAQEVSPRRLTAVNLRTVLDKDGEDADLGGLTRVLGFARNHKTGDVYLLGEIDEGAPAIPLDVLTVALKVMWQGKANPAISLDPDPDDCFGPQHVRLEEFPSDCRSTEFTHIMLEADYEMKKIMLGDDDLGINGYSSFAELLSRNPEANSGEYFRWWLCPRETSGAAVFHIDRGDIEAYFYDSDVKVLTETMKRASTGMMGTGARNPLAESSSNAFTQCYGDIERERPIFRQLHGVFDVAKLASILRSENATDKIFSEIAGRHVKEVPIKDTYSGIGPKTIVCGTESAPRIFYIGGGVVIGSTLRSGDFVRFADTGAASCLDKLAESQEDGVTMDLSIPPVVSLDPENAQLADSDAESFRGLDEIMTGDFTAAVVRTDRVLKRDPSHVRARMVRALAYTMLGRFQEALGDVDEAVKGLPWLAVYRGRIRVAAGDVAGGLADVRTAASQFPDVPQVYLQKAWVETETLQLADARKDYQIVRAVLPFDPDLDTLGDHIRTLSRMKPSEAEEFMKAQFALPLGASTLLSRALTLSQRGDYSTARSLLEQVINSIPDKPGQKDPLNVKESCWLLLAVMDYNRGTAESVKEGGSYLDMIQKRQPTWPSPMFYRAELDSSMSYAQAVGLYLKAAKMSAASDPLFVNARVNNGINLATQIGWELSLKGADKLDSDKGRSLPLVYSVMDQTIASTPQGPAKYVLSLMRKSIAHEAQEIKGKKLSDAENKRLDTQMKTAMLKLPPVPAGSDGTDLSALSMLVSISLQRACRSAETPGDVSDAAQLFAATVKGLHADWGAASTLRQAADQSVTAHGIYAGLLTKQIGKNQRWVSLKKRYDKGGLDATGLLQALDHIAEPLVDKQTALSPFSMTMLRAYLYTQYSDLLPEMDRSKLDAAICSRLSRVADTIESSAHSLVEIEAGKLWFSGQESVLAMHLSSGSQVKQAIVEFHRRAARMNQHFELEAALH